MLWGCLMVSQIFHTQLSLLCSVLPSILLGLCSTTHPRMHQTSCVHEHYTPVFLGWDKLHSLYTYPLGHAKESLVHLCVFNCQAFCIPGLVLAGFLTLLSSLLSCFCLASNNLFANSMFPDNLWHTSLPVISVPLPGEFLRPRPHVQGYFWKCIFLDFHPHANSILAHWKWS